VTIPRCYPAIRSYAKVGFRPVGVMRQYERGGDGRFHDGLLMDLLRGELAPEYQARDC
jgi:aminoglycoside 6'-N-acetyltransferase